MMKRATALLICLTCATPACGSTVPTEQTTIIATPPPDTTYFPAAEWRRAAPATVGLDSTLIARVQNDVAAGRYGAVDGVLVIRNGYLVMDQFNGWSPDRVHTMQSVTKSITSLLFGIVQEQRATNLDTSVVDLLPYSDVANLDARKRALSTRNLLTMRTNMDFWEQPYPGSPLETLNNSREDWVKFVLDRPMTGTPGSAWTYNSGAPIVVCGVMRQRLQEDVTAFAERTLFAPLGIKGATWYRSPYDQLPHCGGGLNLRAQDLARIGYMVLRKGKWGGAQVVPRDWIETSTKPVTHDVYFTNYGSDYGYFWWLFPSAPGAADDDVITASGSGGQWLFIVPKLDLVVVMVASNGAGLDLLYGGILPAVRNR